MGERFLRHNGEWVPRSEFRAPPQHGPYVITDTMPATMNHADGRRYDSKRAFERAVRAAGCEVVGNEALPAPQRAELPPVGPDIKRAIEELN